MRQWPHGDTFSNNTVSGSNNRVHFGHNFYAGDPQESPVDRICKLLYLTDPRIDRQSLLEAKHGIVEGTCEWLLQHEKLQRWSTVTGAEDTAPPGLWLSGEPGKGKTMLAIYISQMLEDYCKSQQDRSLLYYFCVHNNDKRNTPVTILRSWIRQLLGDEPELFHHVSDKFQTDTLENLVTLWDIFLTLVRNSVKKAIFCIVDGLDECKEQLKHFIGQVHSYFEPNKLSDGGKLRLMVFSRETPMCSFGEQSSFDRINLDTDANEQVQDAIFLFLEKRGMPRYLVDGGGNEAFREEVIPLLNRLTGQSFLWIGYVAEKLRGCQNMMDFEREVRSVPEGHDQIYERMLEEIRQEDLERSRRTREPREKAIGTTIKLLQWAVLARRPLTLRETAIILGIKRGKDKDYEAYMVQTVRDRISKCGYLLKVNNNQVELLHKSAGDFLTRGGEFSNMDLDQYRVHTQEAHNAIAMSCLDMIKDSLHDHPSLGIDEASTLSILEKEPLLGYAILYWPGHLAEAETAGNTVLDSSPVIKQKKLRSRWWMCYWDLSPHDRYLPTSFSLLHLAAYFGVYELARRKLDTSKLTHVFSRPVNRQDSHGRTPLSWAAERGHLEIVKLLLEKNADKEICEVGGGRALNRSFHSGRPDVIELLIHRKAETDYRFKLPFPSARTGEQWRKLDWKEKPHILRLLDGNSIKATCLRHTHHLPSLVALWGALWLVFMGVIWPFAIKSGLIFFYVSIGLILAGAAGIIYVSLSIERIIQKLTGASANEVVGIYSEFGWFTPLTRCIYTRSLEITDLFLENMSEPNFSVTGGRTALSHAAQAGHEDLVRQILDRQVDVNEREPNYIMQRLRGPLVMRIIESYANRLDHPISFQRREDTRTQRLREKAGSCAHRMTWGNGCTAFARAAQGPRELTVKTMTLLIERGAKTDLTDVLGQTPLFYAAYEGNEDAARLLLSQGIIDVNYTSDLEETPLSVAVSRGQLRFVQFLVANGADVMHRRPAIIAALVKAAGDGNKELVACLVEKGVPLDIHSKNGYTPLLLAAAKGRHDVVAFLIEEGASVGIKTTFSKVGMSPVILASLHGHDECVNVLLRKNARPATTSPVGLFWIVACIVMLQWHSVRLLLRRTARPLSS